MILSDYIDDIMSNNMRFNGEFYMSCVIKRMLQEGHVFQGLELHRDAFFSVGTPKQVTTWSDYRHCFLFDLDGTLVDTDNVYMDVWNQLVPGMDRAKFLHLVQGNSDSVALRALGLDLSNDKDFSKRKDDLFIENVSKVTPLPGAIEFLKVVKREGHAIGLVTNCNKRAATSILSNLDIEDIFDVIVTGDTVSRSKPHPEPYLSAMASLGFPASRTLIFEDSDVGMASAIASCPKRILRIGHDLSDYVDLLPKSLIDGNYLERMIEAATGATNVVIGTEKATGGYVADVLDVTCTYSKIGTITKYVVKLPVSNNVVSNNVVSNNVVSNNVVSNNVVSNNVNSIGNDVIKELELHERECYFYEHLRDLVVGMSIPKCHGILSQNRGILLERMCTEEYVINKDLNDTEMTLDIVRRIAGMHAQFHGSDTINRLKTASDYTCMARRVRNNWPAFEVKWSHRLTTRQIDIGRSCVECFEATQTRLSSGTLTLCHGDVKSGNIFHNRVTNEPTFIDWQYVSRGKGVQDLVFFAIDSTDITLFPLLKSVYYSKIKNTYSDVDEFERDIVAAARFFPFFVCMWFGLIEDGVGKAFADVFVPKAFAFLESITY
jgi:HAD superfamily hydrolase (TIGR01509 family)